MKYWVSTKRATGLITVNEEGIIIKTCPIWKKWIGKDFGKMLEIFKSFGLKTKEIK